MSSPLEDFIIQLGFDTSKVGKQIEQLHKQLSQIAVKADAKRVQQGLAREKQIADAAIKETKRAVKAKEKVETQAEARQRMRKEKADKQDKSTYRKGLERRASNVVAEYERGATGPSNANQRLNRLIKTNASNSQIKAFIEELRGSNDATRNRMKAEGKLKSFDSVSAAKADLDMLKMTNEVARTKAQMDVLGMNTSTISTQGKTLDQLKKYNEELTHAVKLHKIQNKGMRGQGRQGAVAKAPTSDFINNLINARLAGGGFGAKTQREGNPFLNQLELGLSKQQTERQAKVFAGAAQQAYKYRGIDRQRVDAAVASGNIDQLRSTVTELGRMNAQLERTRRHAIGAAAAMGSLHDSTRNMVREYASLYTMLAGTYSIKEQAKALDGMQAGLVAVTNDSKEAQQATEYLKDTILQNGLSMKEAGKDFVKLKAAMGKGMPLQDTIDAFEALARTGVVFQISQDDMTGTIRGLSQMFSKSGIQAQELKEQLSLAA